MEKGENLVRVTQMFSATLPKELISVAEKYLKNHIFI